VPLSTPDANRNLLAIAYRGQPALIQGLALTIESLLRNHCDSSDSIPWIPPARTTDLGGNPQAARALTGANTLPRATLRGSDSGIILLFTAVESALDRGSHKSGQ